MHAVHYHTILEVVAGPGSAMVLITLVLPVGAVPSGQLTTDGLVLLDGTCRENQLERARGPTQVRFF